MPPRLEHARPGQSVEEQLGDRYEAHRREEGHTRLHEPRPEEAPWFVHRTTGMKAYRWGRDAAHRTILIAGRRRFACTDIELELYWAEWTGDEETAGANA